VHTCQSQNDKLPYQLAEVMKQVQGNTRERWNTWACRNTLHGKCTCGWRLVDL